MVKVARRSKKTIRPICIWCLCSALQGNLLALSRTSKCNKARQKSHWLPRPKFERNCCSQLGQPKVQFRQRWSGLNGSFRSVFQRWMGQYHVQRTWRCRRRPSSTFSAIMKLSRKNLENKISPVVLMHSEFFLAANRKLERMETAVFHLFSPSCWVLRS